jgi:hypothetical protein
MPDTMYTGRTIDMTPTWEALVRPMCAVLENPSRKPDVADAKRNIRGQFMRMADAADRWNEHVKNGNAALRTFWVTFTNHQQFQCEAESEGHAWEQAHDAEPDLFVERIEEDIK